MKRTSLNIIYFVSTLLALVISNRAHAQHNQLDTIKVYAFITPSGDTIPMSYLPDVQVNTKLTKAQKRYWAEWQGSAMQYMLRIHMQLQQAG